MKRIKVIEGKTILRAERGGDAYADQSNFALQLKLSDGTTFCIDACGRSELVCDGVLYPTDDDCDPQQLWTSRHSVTR